MNIQPKCKQHPRYKGVYKPNPKCPSCKWIYELARHKQDVRQILVHTRSVLTHLIDFRAAIADLAYAEEAEQLFNIIQQMQLFLEVAQQDLQLTKREFEKFSSISQNTLDLEQAQIPL